MDRYIKLKSITPIKNTETDCNITLTSYSFILEFKYKTMFYKASLTAEELLNAKKVQEVILKKTGIIFTGTRFLYECDNEEWHGEIEWYLNNT